MREKRRFGFSHCYKDLFECLYGATRKIQKPISIFVPRISSHCFLYERALLCVRLQFGLFFLHLEFSAPKSLALDNRQIKLSCVYLPSSVFVPLNSSSMRHSGSSYDNFGVRRQMYRLRGSRILSKYEPWKRERVIAFPEIFSRSRIHYVCMAAKGFGNSDGKRRVQIDRDSLPRDALRNLVYFKSSICVRSREKDGMRRTPLRAQVSSIASCNRALRIALSS